MHIKIREGTPKDIPLLLSFIKSIAEYEKLADQVSATEEILQESLFGERPVAYTLFTFIENKPVAYAVYFFTFSTFTGKRGLWLEDIFVEPEFRRGGIAQKMMVHLANIAEENHWARFEWTVLDWNKPAIDFYKELGAKMLDDWRICRLEFEGIKKLSRK